MEFRHTIFSNGGISIINPVSTNRNYRLERQYFLNSSISKTNLTIDCATTNCSCPIKSSTERLAFQSELPNGQFVVYLSKIYEKQSRAQNKLSDLNGFFETRDKDCGFCEIVEVEMDGD